MINKDDTSTEEAVFCLRAHTHTLPRLFHACASLIALDPCSFSPTLRPGTSLAPAGVVVAYVNRAACCVSCSPRRNELLSGAEAVPRTRCTHMGMSKLKRDRGREICIYPQVLRGRQRGERSSFIVSLQRIGGTSYFAPIPRVGSQLFGEHKPTLYQAQGTLIQVLECPLCRVLAGFSRMLKVGTPWRYS